MDPACPAIENRQRQGERHEQGGEHRGGAGEQIGGGAPAHESAHALGGADAKPAALTPLDEDDADQGERDEEMEDEEDGDHGNSRARALLARFAPSG